MKQFVSALAILASIGLAYGQDTLWVAGGGSRPLIAQGTAEAVDMSGDQLTCDAIPSLPNNAYGAMGAKTSGLPVVCGGQHQFDENSGCYIYNIENRTWDILADMETNRRDASVFQLTDNDFIIVGGWALRHLRTTEVYTASEGTFTAGERLPYGVDQACAAQINSTHFVLSGGETDSFAGEMTNEVLIYNALNQKFDSLPSFNVSRGNHVCGVVNGPNGQEFVIGGGENTDEEALDSVEILNLSTLVWRAGNPMPKAITAASSDPLGDSFITCGGFENNEDGLTTIYEYIPADDSWDRRREGIGGFFLGRGHHASVIVDDSVINVCN